MSDFPEGIFFNKPHEKAPDFVKGTIDIKVEQAVQWLKENANDSGYVKLDLKIAKSGNPYLSHNDWQPQGKTNLAPEQPEDFPF